MSRKELDRLIDEAIARKLHAEPAGWCFDFRRGVTTWTPCMYRLLGLPQGDAHRPEGQLMARLSPDSFARFNAAYFAAREFDGGRLDMDLDILHHSGDYIPVRVTGTVHFQGGSPDYMDGTLVALPQRQAISSRG